MTAVEISEEGSVISTIVSIGISSNISQYASSLPGMAMSSSADSGTTCRVLWRVAADGISRLVGAQVAGLVGVVVFDGAGSLCGDEGKLVESKAMRS